MGTEGERCNGQAESGVEPSDMSVHLLSHDQDPVLRLYPQRC